MRDFVFGIVGGSALLMYGVEMMSNGLERASGKMMKKILSIFTSRLWTSFLVGTFLTALVQSSTAVTVLTVGFVNAGLMKFSQAVGIIYGANIGTTITAQLMSASYDFNLTDYCLPILGSGFLITTLFKNRTVKSFGKAVMGFGFMFMGLKILNAGVPFMSKNETLKYFFRTYTSVPLIALLLGAVATALVQSSSATVGIVMVLGEAGLLDITSSICLMLGNNIGTCITAQLASLTGNINARRTAWAHTLYNMIGAVIIFLILPWFVQLVQFITLYFNNSSDINAQIANSHTIFNVLSAVIFLPLNKYYVKFIEFVVPK